MQRLVAVVASSQACSRARSAVFWASPAVAWAACAAAMALRAVCSSILMVRGMRCAREAWIWAAQAERCVMDVIFGGC